MHVLKYMDNRNINNNKSHILSLQDKFDVNNNKFDVISIRGKLDVSSAEQVSKEISDKFTEPKSIFIDMSRCEYISNYGLYILSNIVNKAKLSNVKIIFIAIIDKISEIFDLTGFSNTIELAPTVEDAIKEYALN